MGLAVLSRPERINALHLDLLRPLEDGLRRFADDPAIAVVAIRGEGDRGFCAGGDVRMICEHLARGGPVYGLSLFAAEYRMDYLVYRFPKPVAIFGHGAVMGAGFGLFVAGGLRIADPDARFAMPEVSIGLFPDCAAARFLSALPGGVGRFFAVTGTTMDATTACAFGLADRIVPRSAWSTVEGSLSKCDPGVSVAEVASVVPEVESKGASFERVSSVIAQRDFPECLSAPEAHADPWLAAGADAFARACPTSVRIADEALRRGASMSLAEVLRQDLTLAAQCMRRGNFPEGVRARLIDRDNQPNWEPAELADVDDAVVAAHFEEPFEGRHPLAELSD